MKTKLLNVGGVICVIGLIWMMGVMGNYEIEDLGWMETVRRLIIPGIMIAIGGGALYYGDR